MTWQSCNTAKYVSSRPVKKINLILFDEPETRGNLLPFTFSRPVVDIRIGILTIREKWERLTGVSSSTLTEKYLSEKFTLKTAASNLLVNAAILPDQKIWKAIHSLKENELLLKNSTLIAAAGKETGLKNILKRYRKISYPHDFNLLQQLPDIFSLNEKALTDDFLLVTKGRNSQPLDKSNQLIGKNIFIEKGAKISSSILNTTTGPIYIGKDAEVMEGSMIRGPFALCEHAVVKMGAKIYGATTIGPHSKVAGEVNNSVLFGYSNKSHDGFLGNSVIGEWCNLGADTNNSNLKNNYAPVKLWHYPSESFRDTGLQFCGLFMGDHSKCGINTMFNTGTVVGFSSNIFGAGFPRNFIPSFSWGGASGISVYALDKALETAERVLQRRNIPLTETEKKIWKHLFEQTKKIK